MTAEFTCEEIIDITSGRLAAGMEDDGAGSICTDTRALKEGQWYLALSGERFDGHDFLGDAFSAGARGAIVAERSGYAISNPQFPLIAVDDTLEAFHMLARNWRKRINPYVIGVTGSSGKTTTKEMCAAVFSRTFRCHKSRQNENNEIGVPKTLLSMPDDTQVVVVEMAMRGLKQIDQLARCALPDVAIVTNAGVAHLELLGSLENIARAKAEIFGYLKQRKGIGIIGQPVERLLTAARDVFDGTLLLCDEDSIEVLAVTTETTRFRIKELDGEFEVRAHGRPLLEDAWCAIMAGQQKGLSAGEIAAGLRTFEPVGGRGNRIVCAGGALILDETYNANPDSVRASIVGLLDERAYPHAQKIVVLGELAELGPTEKELHYEVGKWIKDKPIQLLITVGQLARNIADGAQGSRFSVVPCTNHAEAEKELRARLSADTCILIKGSHRANLDRIVDSLSKS
jgi:UDP-N-acetylmuramoyl-tripeptide--D-alanyl-D-alanine ligase